jgi:hypothetical protein
MASPRQKEQMRRARDVKTLNRILGGAQFTKSDFIKAMVGTGGIKTQIAKRLGSHRVTVAALLHRPDWADVRALYLAEVQAGLDDAENAIRVAICDHTDLPTATANARWLLSRRRPKEYGDKSTTVFAGGDNPVRVNAANINIDALNLPIEMKRKLLQAIDAREREMLEKQLRGDRRKSQQQLVG